jgi:cell division topological specificity factor
MPAMDWLKLFRAEKKSSAQTAKDRLMVAVAIQRKELSRHGASPPFLGKMREEIMAVIRKYYEVPDSAVQFNLDHEDGLEVLELNIVLPERS